MHTLSHTHIPTNTHIHTHTQKGRVQEGVEKAGKIAGKGGKRGRRESTGGGEGGGFFLELLNDLHQAYFNYRFVGLLSGAIDVGFWCE